MAVFSTTIRQIALTISHAYAVTLLGHQLIVQDFMAGINYLVNIETGTSLTLSTSTGMLGISVAYDGRLLWFVDAGSDEIKAVNPDTGTVIHTIDPGVGSLGSVGFDGHHLWVGVSAPNRFLIVDPVTGTVIRSTNSPGGSPTGFAFLGPNVFMSWTGSMWLRLVSVEDLAQSLFLNFNDVNLSALSLGYDGRVLYGSDGSTPTNLLQLAIDTPGEV